MKKSKKGEPKSVTVNANDKKGPDTINTNADDDDVNSGFSNFLRSDSGNLFSCDLHIKGLCWLKFDNKIGGIYL
jgi:hypothetical protein